MTAEARKPKRRRYGTRIVLAVVLLVALTVVFYPREPLLLEHATRVLDMRATDPVEAMNYGWLSDHDLLYFRSGGVFCRLDTMTGMKTDLPTLTRQIKSSIPDCEQVSHWPNPSPDGQSVLWGPTTNAPVFVASVDGVRRWEWPKDVRTHETGASYWMADSQHWTEWMYGPLTMQGSGWTKVKIHSLATPHVSQTISSLPPVLKGLEILSVQSEDTIIARTRDGETILPTSPPRPGPFTVSIQTDYRRMQEVSVWSLRKATPLHQYRIRLPGLALQVKASPQGDRLAWVVQFQSVSPFLKKIRRFIPAWKEEKRLSLALYVSDLDGNHLQEIGRVDRNPKPESEVIEELHWLPGGKRLSFIMDDNLWTVPVE